MYGRKKNARSYITKSGMLGNTTSLDYNIAIYIEFMMPILCILNRSSSLADCDSGKLKVLFNTAEKSGVNSQEFKKAIQRLVGKSERETVLAIRRKYPYITKDILADSSLLTISDIKLADINYKLKTGQAIYELNIPRRHS